MNYNMEELEFLVTACLILQCQLGDPAVNNEVPKEPRFRTPLISNVLEPDYSSFPKRHRKYLKFLVKKSSNASRESAQTKQESNWKVRARSPYAKGLRQFTDATGKWMSRTQCRKLGSYRPYDPYWSLECGVIYMNYLERKVERKLDKLSYCKKRRIAEQMYNGGSWVLRELKRSKGTLEDARRNCLRASWACKENYEYPIRIDQHQTTYKPLGGTICRGD
jgi:hypothetical protein